MVKRNHIPLNVEPPDEQCRARILASLRRGKLVPIREVLRLAGLHQQAIACWKKRGHLDTSAKIRLTADEAACAWIMVFVGLLTGLRGARLCKFYGLLRATCQFARKQQLRLIVLASTPLGKQPGEARIFTHAGSEPLPEWHDVGSMMEEAQGVEPKSAWTVFDVFAHTDSLAQRKDETRSAHAVRMVNALHFVAELMVKAEFPEVIPPRPPEFEGMDLDEIKEELDKCMDDPQQVREVRRAMGFEPAASG